MKKKQYSCLLSVLVPTILAGCSAGDGTDSLPETQKVEIRLGGNVSAVQQQVRSAVSEGQYLTAMLIGREGTNLKTAAQAWTASGSFYAHATTEQEVSIAPKQYYNDTEETHTYILGVYPSGTLQGDKVIFTRSDGVQDVMLSGWTDAGTKAGNKPTETLETAFTADNAHTLTFDHQTAQVYFVAQAGTNEEGELFSEPTYLESITLRNAQVPSEVNLTVPSVTFAAPADLSIPGIPSVGLTDRPTPCGSPVMVNESAQLVVDIVLNTGGSPILFNGITLKDEANPKANLVTAIGKRHKVTLTFTAPDTDPEGAVRVNATATVNDWMDGNSGSIIL